MLNRPQALAMALAIVFAVGVSTATIAIAQSGANRSFVVASGQAWQQRRAERFKVIQIALANPSVLDKRFDQMLTDFEMHPLNQTPLENIDLLGYYYAPRQGLDKAMPIIVMNATLGWYDVLRFGSSSGQAEIVNNENFFKRPLMLAGKQRIEEYVALSKSDPEQNKQAIDKGLAFAEKFKDTNTYDRKWPTAYGLERMICAQGGACSPITAAPETQWPVLWEQAKERVREYYKVQ